MTPYGELAEVLDALPLLVREKRRREGLSLRAAARAIDVDFNTLSRFERGADVMLSNAVTILRWVAT